LEIIGCRICGEPDLKLVYDYGMMPLVNNYTSDEEYPLVLVRCPECGLVQITETVSPEKIFTDYPYFSSQSQTMLDHSKELVEELIDSRGLTEDSLVIELASNDGYLLQYYAERGIPVMGIEPAQNIAKYACEKGIPTLAQFFGLGVAHRLRLEGIRADVIHAHNVLAHVADLHGFVDGIKLLLKAGGVAVIEVPYLKDLVENCEYDTVYHEHLCYFALKPLERLFELHGLGIRGISFQDIHGGSVRLYVMHGKGIMGCHEDIDLYGFKERLEQTKTIFTSCLSRLKSNGKSIAAYGAAAKGCVLFNLCGIDANTIDFIVDSTPAKQGKYFPGTGIYIYPPRKLIENQPDYCVILPWNFSEEIMKKEPKYKGKFILTNPLKICG
jgi:SAM-dependent methyltransferase